MTFTDLSARFPLGSRVRKKRGSSWRGVVVGEYTNQPHTEQGYAVASLYEPGNVQVYPVAALEAWDIDADPVTDPIAADRIAALIAAGDRLAGFAGHDDQCQIMTHGVWSDEVPCTCGYGAAWQAWREVSGHE